LSIIFQIVIMGKISKEDKILIKKFEDWKTVVWNNGAHVEHLFN